MTLYKQSISIEIFIIGSGELAGYSVQHERDIPRQLPECGEETLKSDTETKY